MTSVTAVPGVSVVICTYRREATLRSTIADVLSQVDIEPELIVVDQTEVHDAETSTFLRAHAARFNLIQLSQPNLPCARNHGLAAAKSDIVAFIDDDIRLDSKLLSRLASHFADDAVSAVAPIVVGNDGEAGARAQYSRRYGRALACGDGPLRRVREVLGACFAVRRAVAHEIGGFDPLIGELHSSASGEDSDFFLRLSAAGYRVFIDLSAQVRHLSDTPGGCDARTVDPRESLRAHLHAFVYLTLKHDRALERMTVAAVLRLARGCIGRRMMFRRAGVRGAVACIREIRLAVEYVRLTWRRMKVETPLPGSLRPPRNKR